MKSKGTLNLTRKHLYIGKGFCKKGQSKKKPKVKLENRVLFGERKGEWSAKFRVHPLLADICTVPLNVS